MSADSIIPGAADGSGGGAATLGVDSGSRLTTLTTDFHEFIGQVTQENQAVLQYGPFFQWSEQVRQDNPVPSGPLNPQALNRYSYVLNNPLRYVDPTGHSGIRFSIKLKLDAWNDFKNNYRGFNATTVDGYGTNGFVIAGTAGTAFTAGLSLAGPLGKVAATLTAPFMAAYAGAVSCVAGKCTAGELREVMVKLDRIAQANQELSMNITIQEDGLFMYTTIEAGGETFTLSYYGQSASAQFADALSTFLGNAEKYWERNSIEMKAELSWQ